MQIANKRFLQFIDVLHVLSGLANIPPSQFPIRQRQTSSKCTKWNVGGEVGNAARQAMQRIRRNGMQAMPSPTFSPQHISPAVRDTV